MNKTFNAVALANKALRKENTDLWKQNDELQRGLDEIKTLYMATVTQLVQAAGGEVTLPKVNVEELLQKYRVEAKHDEHSVTMTLKEADDAERED